MNTPCRGCGTAKDGAGAYCVLCFARRHKPCPNCMVQGADRRWRPRRQRDRYRHSVSVNCDCCNNERWIVLDT